MSSKIWSILSLRDIRHKTEEIFTSLDELGGFVGVDFVMGYHKLPTLRYYYWETINPSVSVIYSDNVMATERFKEILSNPHFSNNEEALPWEHPDHDRAFKVWWLIN